MLFLPKTQRERESTNLKSSSSPKLISLSLVVVLLAVFGYLAFGLPSITYVSPTLSDNSTTGSNWVFVNVTSSEDLNQSLLEWGNSTGFTNVSMTNVSGMTNWYKNMTDLADGTYNYTIWAENATGGWNQTQRRFVYIDTTPHYSIYACQDLTIENGSYVLAQNVSSAGTCFTIKANGVVLDGNKYTINYSTGLAGYGVNVTSKNNVTIKNLTIIQGNSSVAAAYAIYGKTMTNSTITNNLITTSGSSSFGIYLITASNSNTVSGNNISTTGGSNSIYIVSSNTNQILNNLVTSQGGSASGIRLDSSSSNNITGGSVISPVREYYLSSAGTTNTFTNTNFTSSRKIYFADTGSQFNYNNDTVVNIWLKTNISTVPSYLTRTLVNWSNTLMIWNDTNSTANVVSNYVLTGLYANTNYAVYNTSSGVQTNAYNITTGVSGSLNFTIALSGNTEIKVNTISGVAPSVLLNFPINNFNQTSASITFNCTAYDDINLTNITLYNNFGGVYQANGTNSSGINNTAYLFDRIAPANGTFTWNCLAYDNSSQINFASQNFTITVDAVPPTSNSPNNASYSQGSQATIGWILQDNYAGGDYTVYRNGTIQNQSTWQNNTNLNIWINASAQGTWNYTASYNDSLGNPGISNEVDITIVPAITVANITNKTSMATTVYVLWNATTSANNTVEYSSNSDLSNSNFSHWQNNTQNPVIKLWNLQPGTTWYYRVWSYNANGPDYTNSSTYNFTTPSCVGYKLVSPSNISQTQIDSPIQEAIDSLCLGGGTAELTAGTWNMTSSIMILQRNNVLLQGASMDDTILQTNQSLVFIQASSILDNSYIINETEGGAAAQDPRTAAAGNITNITIRNIHLNGSGESVAIPTGRWEGILIVKGVNSTVSNIWMERTGTGLRLQNTFNVTLNGNLIDTNDFGGFFISHGQSNVISSNTFRGTDRWYAIDFNGDGVDNTVQSNIFIGSISGAIKLYSNSHGNRIINNTFNGTNLSSIGVITKDAFNNTIERNVFVEHKASSTYSAFTQMSGGLADQNKYNHDNIIKNNVFYNNKNTSILSSVGIAPIVKNNIITNNTGPALYNISSENCTYNLIWGNGDNSGCGTGTISADPLFANASAGDFHLKSQAGRWNGTGWVTDAQTSPAIDAGNPSDDYSLEPSPNGDRINMGAYGGTSEASKTYSANSLTSCGNLDTANTYYTLTQNVSSSGTCFNILANNITLDGQGYWVNYSTGATAGYGVNITNRNNITVKNLNVVQGNSTNTYAYGIYGSATTNSTIQNNSITTSGSYGYGIYIMSFNESDIVNNSIRTNALFATGVALNGSNSNRVTNNTITASNSQAHGIYLLSSSNANTLLNNMVSLTGASANGIYLASSNNNNITGGSVVSKSWYDYYLASASTTNNFTGTNFTASRRIGFSDVLSYFNYNNQSDNIWLKTNISVTNYLTRTLIIWSNTTMKWNDTNSTAGIIANYNLTGLLASTEYKIYNTSQGTTTNTYTLTTDSTGSLSFTINLNGNTEIVVNTSIGNNPPTVVLNSPINNFNQTSSAITFNCTAYDDVNLTNVTLYNNINGTWQANGTNSSGINNTAYIFTRNAASNGTFTWNCLAYNNASLSSFASQNFTVTVDVVLPTSNSPANASYSQYSSATINWTLYDNYASGYYTVYKNGTMQNQSTWTNNTNLNIWINTSTQGTWNYTINYNDSLGNAGIPSTVIINITGDLTPPQYSLNSTNATTAGTSIKHSLYWTDNTNLSGYIFSFDNGTGNFVNDSFVSITGTSNWSNVTKTVNSTVGTTIRWRVYANDTNNNWNVSLNYSYITTNYPPKYSDLGTNNTVANQSTQFYTYWQEDTGLSGFIFSTNNNGTWVNDSWQSITSLGNWSNATKLLNSTVGVFVSYRVYANDTANQWNDTGIQTLITTSAGNQTNCTKYVATYGNNASDGLTLATAWKNPTYAAQQAVEGDTICLVDGTWNDEYVLISKPNMTITSFNGTPTININDTITSPYVFGIESANNVTLKNIKIINNVNLIGINNIWINNSENTIIDNLTILINNSNASGRGNAVYMVLSDHTIISNSNFSKISANSGFSSGIYAFGVSPTRPSNYVMVKNTVIDGYGTYGIMPDSGSSNWTIENNVIKNGINANFGIRSYSGGGGHIIRNNTFIKASQGSAGAARSAWVNSASSRTVFENNDISGYTHTAGIMIDGQATLNTRVIVQNNIIHDLDTTLGAIDLRYLSDDAGRTTYNTTFINNSIYNIIGIGLNIMSGINDTIFQNTTFYNISGWDINLNVNKTGILFIDTKFSKANISSVYAEGGAISFLSHENYIITGLNTTLYYPTYSTYINKGGIEQIYQYNMTARPTTGYLNITVNQFNTTTDTYNITVNSSVAENPTWFNLTAQNASTWYNIKRDGTLYTTIQSGSDKVVRFFYNDSGVDWSSHTFEFTQGASGLTVSLNSPANALLTNNATQIFNCSSTSGNNLTNITRYANFSGTWQANGTTNITGTSNSSQWVNALADGTYIWNCLAYDTTSNSSFAASNYTLTIDTAAPVIQIASPQNITYGASVWFNITLDEAGSWTGYSLDGAANITMANSSGNWNAQNTSMANGQHTVKFYANDTAGNMNSTNVTFTVDTAAPSVALISPASAYDTSSTTISFSFNVTDNLNASMACSLYINGTSVATNSSTINATATTFANTGVSASLNQNWTVSCSDGVNTYAPANRTFNVDNVIPTSNSPVDASYSQGASATINWNLSDNYAGGYYRAYRNGTLQNISTWTNNTNLNVWANTSSLGMWNYTIAYNDSLGNNGVPDTVIITITGDLTAPTYSLNSTNSTNAGMPVKHSLYWVDDIQLSGYIFSFDSGNGTFYNDSWVAFTGTGNWSNVTKTVNSTVGATIQWKVYANDTSNNWNASSVYAYNTTACTESWSYSDWSACSGGMQTRTATDANSCGTTVNRSALSQPCSSGTTGSSGGGGGGGGSTTTKTITVTPLDPLTKVVVSLKQSLENPSLTIVKVESVTVSAPSGSVYHYINITKNKFNNSQINNATIDFKVNKSWILTNGFANVYLAHYDNGWTKLKTDLINSTTTMNYYRAYTNSFSYFAIIGEKATAKTVPPPVETPKETAKEVPVSETQTEIQTPVTESLEGTSQQKPYLTYIIAAIVLLVITAAFAMKKKPNTYKTPQSEPIHEQKA